MADYTVRPACAADSPAVVALSNMWQNEGSIRGNMALDAGDERLQDWLDGEYFLVGESDGVVVSYAVGAVKLGKGPVFDPEGERFLELQRVFVHAGHRGGGLGSRLVEALLNKAKAAGVQRSIVGSNNIDWRAIHRFYERQGFKMLSIDMFR